jgi:hypothetical protein
MNFQMFAAQPWTEEDLQRLTIEEEEVLRARRRHSVVETTFVCNKSRSAVMRAQDRIRKKLG